MWESHSAPNAGNVKPFALLQQNKTFFGEKGSQRGPESSHGIFFLLVCRVILEKKSYPKISGKYALSPKCSLSLKNPFLRNFPPNKGLTEKLFFLRGPLVKKALFWDFVQKRLLFPSIFGQNALIVFCLSLGGGGNFSHRFENGGQTTFEKHGLDKETEERYIDRATLFDCMERKYVRCKETERNN